MMITPKTIEQIRKEIIESKRETRYKIQAYVFVLQGLNFYHAKTGEKLHFHGSELSTGFSEFAAKQYGPLAFDVLTYWGITKTNDFGYIVYNLIDARLIKRQANDQLEDFFDIFDLPQYFKSQQYFSIDKDYIKNVKDACN